MTTRHDDLADRLFEAIGAGEADVVRDCMASEMTVWTNFDDRTVDRDAALTTVAWLARKVDGLRYDVLDRIELDDGVNDGFVQQHVLRGRGPNGTEIAMPACVIATVVDGRVASMREYCDPAAITAGFT